MNMNINIKNWLFLRMNLVIFVIICLTGCHINSKMNSTTTDISLSTADTLLTPIDSSQLYFPPKTLVDNNPRSDSFVNSWYSSQLFAMKEPVIYSDSTNKQIYRFTWLRTFHNPIAIRVENTENDFYLFWKLCDGAGGYEPGRPTVNKQRRLDDKEWETFINKMNLMNFWRMPTIDSETEGHDGAQWILEGKNGSEYHVVDRWSQGGTVDYYKCCEYLISLTDLKIADKDKY